MPRKNGEHQSSHATWTASRALRLLRPISSRIEPLRRLARSERAPEPILSTSDPAWLHKPGLRRRTHLRPPPYTTRAGARIPDASFLNRPHPDPGPPPPEILVSSPIPVPKQRLILGTSLGARDDLEEGIVKGLETLLERTAEDGNRGRLLGSPGLVETCLANVPCFIRWETERRKAVDPNCEDDVVGETYADLEGWGPHPGGGYAGLGQVVRAHGLELVMGAIGGRTISLKSLKLIADVLACSATRAERVRFKKELLFSGHLLEVYPPRPAANYYKKRVSNEVLRLPVDVVCQAMQARVLTPADFSKEHWNAWLSFKFQQLRHNFTEMRSSEVSMVKLLELLCFGCPSSLTTRKQESEELIRSGCFAFQDDTYYMASSFPAALRSAYNPPDIESYLGRRDIFLTMVDRIVSRSSSLHQVESVVGRSMLAVSLLTSALLMKLVAVDSHGSTSTASCRRLITSLRLWANHWPGPDPVNWTIYNLSERLIESTDYGYPCDESTATEHGKDAVLIVLSIAEQCENEDAQFGQRVASAMVERLIEARPDSHERRLLAREVHLRIEGPDELSNDHGTGRTRSGRKRDDVEDHDDSGYMSMEKERRTPRRETINELSESPDELKMSPSILFGHGGVAGETATSVCAARGSPDLSSDDALHGDDLGHVQKSRRNPWKRQYREINKDDFDEDEEYEAEERRRIHRMWNPIDSGSEDELMA